jgi:glycerol-3-phosphate dehydrogenase
MSRFAAIRDRVFDLVIIGGGIVGAGVARDAALRGLSVALFEKADYGGGTTSGSTRLIHGGLRYLEMFDFRLVRLDLREREILLRIAPHLVKPLEFLLPFYGLNPFHRTRMRAGLFLYDLLSYDKSLPSRKNLTRDDVIKREPHLSKRGLKGAAAYYDAQASLPERLCLENVLDACAHGARAYNYAEVTGAIYEDDDASVRGMRGGRAIGVRVRDRLTNTDADGADDVAVRARYVVNASGPWFDRVESALTGDTKRHIRTTKGIHIAVPPMISSAMALESAVDGRLVFAIPWLGYTWLGTTDTDFDDDPANVRADRADVDYLLRSMRPYFKELDASRIYFSNAGVRALVMEEGSESSVSRLHKISDEAEARRRGLIEILGGKVTGYRAIAEEVIDLACRLLDRREKCVTAETPLPGSRGAGATGAPRTGAGGEALRGALPVLTGAAPVPREVVSYLEARYGTRSAEILHLIAADPALGAPVAPGYPDVIAQVIFAVREEHAVLLDDVMQRRTSLGFSRDQGRAAVRAVARWMALELGWPDSRREAEIEYYRARISRNFTPSRG